MATIVNSIQYGGDTPIIADVPSAPHIDSLANQIKRNRPFNLQRQKGIRNFKLQRQNATIEYENEDEDEAKEEKHYLKNVRIIMMGERNPKLLNDIPEIKNKILNPEIMNLTADKAQIQEVIDLVTRKKETKIKDGKAEWMYCEKSCVKTLSRQIKKEMNSTAFMLRVLTNSVIDTTDDELPLIFIYEPGDGQLSGVWENDQHYFKLKELDPNKDSRLIMGLGPSAAGKTFWAKNVIKLMGKTNDTFPRSFLSVDGGLVRELSYVYQDIVTSLAKHEHISGFENLVSAGWDPFHKSLFKAGHVKKSIQKYLKIQKPFSDSKLPVSLYVPETLGSPFTDGFEKGINPYIKLTEDPKWIGLFIWQGRTPRKDEEWVNKFKTKNADLGLWNENIDALSTTLSGKGRELSEGKKYSSTAYKSSERHGYKALKRAPGARIAIHNSGGRYVPHPGEITDIIIENKNKLYTIRFEDGTIGEKRTNKDIHTKNQFTMESLRTKKERKLYLNGLKIGDKVNARKDYNKSVVIEYPNSEGKYILDANKLDGFNSLYLQKPIELLGQIGGRKTRRRLRRKSRKTKRKRKHRRRKTKRRRKRKSRKR